MIHTKLKDYIFAPDVPLRKAIGDMYKKGVSICLVCDKNKKLLGILTRSDIKAAILRGKDHKDRLSSIMNKDFTWAPAKASPSELQKLAKQPNKYKTGILHQIPLLDAKGRLKGLFTLPLPGSKDAPSVLVTGGAGYVGSHVTRVLLELGYRVVVLDSLVFGKDSIKDFVKHKNFTLIKGDVTNLETLIKAIAQSDHVIHLAGVVGDPASSLDPLQTMGQNHFATKMLIDVCKYYGVSRFIFASSCSVYGSGDSLLTEESDLQPISLYAQSKLYAERELLRERGEDFHPIILRFGTLYGLSPRMRFDLVVNTMTAHAFTNKRITVDGGAQMRPLLHVEDAALACVAALEAPLERVSGEIFNVGDTKENYAIAEIAEMVKKHLPKADIVHLETVRDRRNYSVSSKKINQTIKWKTSRKLSEAIAEMIRALKTGKFPLWSGKQHSNYLMLKSLLEDVK